MSSVRWVRGWKRCLISRSNTFPSLKRYALVSCIYTRARVNRIVVQKKVIPKRPSPVALPPPPPPVIDKKPVGPSARRASQSVLPTIRRSDSGENGVVGGRPKREIHPPPSKDLPYEALPIKTKSKKGKGRKREKDDGTLEQLRYCVKIITDMYKRSYADYAYHFYDPVG
jgi:hypothetical protein